MGNVPYRLWSDEAPAPEPSSQTLVVKLKPTTREGRRAMFGVRSEIARASFRADTDDQRPSAVGRLIENARGRTVRGQAVGHESPAEPRRVGRSAYYRTLAYCIGRARVLNLRGGAETVLSRLLLAVAVAPVLACAVPPHNPVIKGADVTLFIAAPDGTTPSVTGDFTEWQPRQASPLRFRRGWFTFGTTLPPEARVEYLVMYGPGDYRIDQRNPRRVVSVGGEASEIVMPRAETHPELDGSDPPTRALAVRLTTGDMGHVTVYRPSQVTADQLLPIVYFHDGSLMVNTGHVPAILDRLIATGRLRPLMAVFVDPVSRVDDYKASPAFREWFINEVMPVVEADATPPYRAVIGVSRGANAALDLAWQRPDLFARCGLLIPSTSPTDLTAQIERGAGKPIQFSMVAGRYDARWLGEAHALREVLTRRGYALAYREVAEGHGVQTWRAHLDDALLGLDLGGTNKEPRTKN